MNATQQSKVHVERPAVDATLLHEVFPERRQKLQSVLATTPTKINSWYSLASVAETVLGYASVLDPDSALTHESAHARAQGQTGIVLLGCAPEGCEVEVPFGSRKVTLRATPSTRANISTWTDGFYAALMARDLESLARLSEISDEALLWNRYDHFHYSWKGALIAFRSNPESALEDLERASERSRPENVEVGMPEAAAISHALCPMLQALVRRESMAFNEALVAALEAHKALWGREDNVQHGNAWIARGALALACRAHDAGLPVRVTSGYLLPYLIERRHPSLSA